MFNIDWYNSCKRTLEELKDTPPEGRRRYIFVVDSASICESVIYSGCNAALIRDKSDLDEILSLLFDLNFTEYIIIPCCSKAVNAEIESDIRAERRITRGTYLLFGGKRSYYEVHPDELSGRIDKIIASIEKPSALKRDLTTGLIIAKASENLYRDIADYIIGKYDIVNLDGETRIHELGRYYSLYTADKNHNILLDELDNSSAKFRNEVFIYIRKFAPQRSITKGYVPFNNCVYDIRRGDVADYNEDMYFAHLIPHKLDINLRDSKASEFIGKFFNDISAGDDEVCMLLFDLIGYCLLDGNPFQKTFFIYGSGGNGKGVFFSLLNAIMGEENVTYRTWDDLSRATGRNGMIDKRLVLCNDIDSNFVKEPQSLKTLVSCEPQVVKQLYCDEYTATFRGKIISSGNCIPKVNDTSNGWGRRLVIIPFKGDFRAKPDITLTKKITSERVIEVLLPTCLMRLDGLLKRGMHSPKAVIDAVNEYKLENNPMLLFAKEYCSAIKGEENAKTLDVVYNAMYVNFCKENNYKPMSKMSFVKKTDEAGIEKYRDKSTDKMLYYVN